MSAIAQYLKGIGKDVSGSDRYFHPNEPNETKEKLEAEGIRCFLQDGEGITDKTDLIVVSTAVEDTVEEVKIPFRFFSGLCRSSPQAGSFKPQLVSSFWASIVSSLHTAGHAIQGDLQSGDCW